MKKGITWKSGVVLAVLLLLSGCAKEEQVIWETIGLSQETETDSVIRESREENGDIYVDICGAVAVPGVYQLKEGDRVVDAVTMAGGLLANADRDSINQAELLTDGCKIRIFTLEEARHRQESEEKRESELADGRINLNTAGLEELCSLTGIGEARAADIISYRTQHGSFESIEDIMQVSGIKEATFERIKDKIVVE